MKKKSFVVVAVLYVFFSVSVIFAGLFLTDSLPPKISYKINSFFISMDIPVNIHPSNNDSIEVIAPEHSKALNRIISSDMKAAWLDLSTDLKADITYGLQSFLLEAEENISFYTNFHTDTLFIKPDTLNKYGTLADANGNKVDLLREYCARAEKKNWKKCLIADDSILLNSDGNPYFDAINYYLANYSFNGILLFSDSLLKSAQYCEYIKYFSDSIRTYFPNISVGTVVYSDLNAKYTDSNTLNILTQKFTDFILINADSSVSSPTLPFETVMSSWNTLAANYPNCTFYVLHRADLMRAGKGEWASYSELSEQIKLMWDYENIYGSVFYSTASMAGANVPFAQRAAIRIENGTSDNLKVKNIFVSNDGASVTITGSSESGHKLLCNHSLAKANGGSFSFKYMLSPGKNIFEFSSLGAKLIYNIYNNTVPDNTYRFKTSPFTDNGLGKELMCRIIKDDSEQISGLNSANVYRPDYSNLCVGTLDYVDSIKYSEEGYLIYILKSGINVFGINCELITNAYTLPLNNIIFNGVTETNSSTDIVMDTDWMIPVTVKALPQAYSIGYQGYPFNLSSYSAEYIDINFNYTAALYNSELLRFDSNSPFSRYELYQGSKNNLILRLYLRNKGQFYGFDIKVNEYNKLVLSFKKHSDGSLVGKTIMLDPGHGGLAMTGTALSDNTVAERNVTLSIAKKLKSMLEQRGATVLMTRAYDSAYDLDERVEIMSQFNPDLFISIHCDGSDNKGDSGTHTFYFRSYSQPLASAIHNALVYTYRNHIYSPGDTNYSAIDRGIKYYPFYVTRINQCPSVLIETGFMTNPTEGNILVNENCQYWIAQGINDGIVNYFAANNAMI